MPGVDQKLENMNQFRYKAAESEVGDHAPTTTNPNGYLAIREGLEPSTC